MVWLQVLHWILILGSYTFYIQSCRDLKNSLETSFFVLTKGSQQVFHRIVHSRPILFLHFKITIPLSTSSRLYGLLCCCCHHQGSPYLLLSHMDSSSILLSKHPVLVPVCTPTNNKQDEGKTRSHKLIQLIICQNNKRTIPVQLEDRS